MARTVTRSLPFGQQLTQEMMACATSRDPGRGSPRGFSGQHRAQSRGHWEQFWRRGPTAEPHSSPSLPASGTAAAPTQDGGPGRFRRPRGHFRPDALVQSAADNCLGLGRVTLPANRKGQRGAAGLGSQAREPIGARRVGGRGGRPPMGNYGARPGPGGSASRRARFSRAAAAAEEEVEVEDVGHARAGGGACSERVAGRPDVAAGRLRRCGGFGVRAPRLSWRR